MKNKYDLELRMRKKLNFPIKRPSIVIHTSICGFTVLNKELCVLWL